MSGQRQAPTLTPKRRAVLQFIVQQVRERNVSPSHREIAAAVGVRAISTVHKYLVALERLRLLVRDYRCKNHHWIPTDQAFKMFPRKGRCSKCESGSRRLALPLARCLIFW